MAKHVLPPLSLLIGLTASSLASGYDTFLGSQPLPLVLTAARLHQAPAAVPGSISVIDRQLIQASGARELTELLRLVPGMIVVPDNVEVSVNYHGGHAAQARRMQVLIDGRSVYRPGLAQVDWDNLPIALEDIERIEVFRGPNTVSYGANAMTGVINIITLRPHSSLGSSVHYTQGKRGVQDSYARHGFDWTGGAMRISLSSRADDGFDRRSNGSDFRDSIRLSRFNLRTAHDLEEGQTLDWQLAFVEGSQQDKNHHSPSLRVDLLPGERDENSDIKTRDYMGSLRWDLELSPEHSLYVQSSLQQWERTREWRSCDAQALFSPNLRELYRDDPQFTLELLDDGRRGENRVKRRALTALGMTHLLGPGQELALPTGNAWQQAQATTFYGQLLGSYDMSTGTFAHTCGSLNENSRETRFDLELQDTLSLTEDLRVVSVLSYRHDRAEAESHFSGSRNKDIGRLHGQAEWYPHRQWLLQAGAMYEYDSMLADDSLTPRLAINYLPTPAHGFRAVYTEAVRTPDMLELGADWQVYVRDLTPTVYDQKAAYFFLSNRVDGSLQQEQITSRELGYNGHFTELGLRLDIRLFDERIDDLITYWAKIEDLVPKNENSLDFRGWEMEANWRPGLDDRLRLTYASLEFEASHEWDSWYTPRHSGSLSWMHDWGHGLSTGLTHLWADEINRYRFERVDLSVAKRFRIGGTHLLLNGAWQQRLDDNPLSARTNNYDQRHTFWLSAGIEI